MTEDHGMMVKRDNNLIRISPKDYKKGDLILIKQYTDAQRQTKN